MNVPKLRFKEFDGEWEENSLAKLATFSKGKGISKDNLSTDGKPCILYGELYTKYKEVASTIYSRTNIESSDLIKSEKLDVLIPSSGETAKDIACSTCIIQEDVLIGGDLNILRFGKEIDGRFISYQINGIKKLELSKYAQGATVVHLYSQGIKKLRLNIPTIEEQKKISELLLLLNKKIQLQQQKIDLLQEQKKGFLQKMFPKAGEPQPEMRFKGYKDNWKQKKLEEVTSRVKGNDGRMELPTLTISASQGWLDQRERFSANIAGKEQKNYTLLKKGQLSYNHGNSKLAKYGVVFELDAYEEALVPRVYHSFETNNFADSKFIQYMFETKRTDKELAKLISSGARMDGLLNINYDEFMGITVSIPDIKEQKKIAEFFIMLNEKINREKEKVRELEKQKQGFMQQMFI